MRQPGGERGHPGDIARLDSVAGRVGLSPTVSRLSLHTAPEAFYATAAGISS